MQNLCHAISIQTKNKILINYFLIKINTSQNSAVLIACDCSQEP